MVQCVRLWASNESCQRPRGQGSDTSRHPTPETQNKPETGPRVHAGVRHLMVELSNVLAKASGEPAELEVLRHLACLPRFHMKKELIQSFLTMKVTTQHVPYKSFFKNRVVNFIARKF